MSAGGHNKTKKNGGRGVAVGCISLYGEVVSAVL